MTLPEVRESTIRTVSAALKTDEDRYEPDFMEAIIHQYRASAIAIMWREDKRINANWTQQYIAVYSKDLQEDDCFVRFECPALIKLDRKTDGAIYVGSASGNVAYRKVTSRAELANNNLHRYTKTNSRTIKVLWSDGYWEAHGNNLIKELRTDGIFANPTDIPTYNVELDQYPIDEDTLSLMKKLIILSEVVPMAAKEPDRISDSTDKTTQRR